MRRMFVGNPEPKSVRYHQGRKSASVTIRFSDSAACGSCTRPAGAAPPRGRVATTSVDARTHRALGFSVKGCRPSRLRRNGGGEKLRSLG
jgi:hypothetical protein